MLLGVPKAIKALKSYSAHAYPYSACDSKFLQACSPSFLLSPSYILLTPTLPSHASGGSLPPQAISALAITDKISGLCRGFGFVEMEQRSDIAVAFTLLNNSMLNGQKIRIEPDPLAKNGRSRDRVAE